jgi:hypothetical protein
VEIRGLGKLECIVGERNDFVFAVGSPGTVRDSLGVILT